MGSASVPWWPYCSVPLCLPSPTWGTEQVNKYLCSKCYPWYSNFASLSQSTYPLLGTHFRLANKSLDWCTWSYCCWHVAIRPFCFFFWLVLEKTCQREKDKKSHEISELSIRMFSGQMFTIHMGQPLSPTQLIPSVFIRHAYTRCLIVMSLLLYVLQRTVRPLHGWLRKSNRKSNKTRFPVTLWPWVKAKAI